MIISLPFYLQDFKDIFQDYDSPLQLDSFLVLKVTMHFVWGYLSRMQTVAVLTAALPVSYIQNNKKSSYCWWIIPAIYDTRYCTTSSSTILVVQK